MSANIAFQVFPALSGKRVVLASQSPRRKELLQQLGLDFEIIPSTFEEDLPKEKFKPADYAAMTATHKAQDVYRKLAAAQQQSADTLVVIGADTVVDANGVILEKPDDAAHAQQMLRMLSGSSHYVHTGVAIVIPANNSSTTEQQPYYTHSFSVTTTVEFDELPEDLIKSYIESGDPFGKAGSYGIQSGAGMFVRHLHGDYFNVVGFPLNKFVNEMRQLLESGKI